MACKIDVQNAFLKGVLEEELWLELPHGFEIEGYRAKMLKALYGFKLGSEGGYFFGLLFGQNLATFLSTFLAALDYFYGCRTIQ